MKPVLSLVLGSALGLTLCLAGTSAAEDFDSKKAAATAGQLADQIKQVRADLDADPAAPESLKKDLKNVEAHAANVRFGLEEGNSMQTTQGAVVVLTKLVKQVRKDAAGLKLSAGTQKKVAGAEATALALEAMYGVAPEAVGSGSK